MQNGKEWWKSKTVWFNVLMTMCTFIETNSAALRGMMGDKAMAYLLLIATFGNVALRFYTSLPIHPTPYDDGGEHENS